MMKQKNAKCKNPKLRPKIVFFINIQIYTYLIACFPYIVYAVHRVRMLTVSLWSMNSEREGGIENTHMN